MRIIFGSFFLHWQAKDKKVTCLNTCMSRYLLTWKRKVNLTNCILMSSNHAPCNWPYWTKTNLRRKKNAINRHKKKHRNNRADSANYAVNQRNNELRRPHSAVTKECQHRGLGVLPSQPTYKLCHGIPVSIGGCLERTKRFFALTCIKPDKVKKTQRTEIFSLTSSVTSNLWFRFDLQQGRYGTTAYTIYTQALQARNTLHFTSIFLMGKSRKPQENK